MIVSWNWLAEYVDLKMSHDDLVDRLTMSGLNHEGTESIGDDQAIDLEVTSNRADCLGHMGVAREIAALYDIPLNFPDPQPPTSDESVDDLCSVDITSPETCFRYTARLIKGVKIGPSPQWLVERLATLGIGTVNNVVDVTNFVMMECGQPLHAFDFAKIKGGKIIVRSAADDEKFQAIDHRDYVLNSGMCVIADDQSAVALGGVMGGADSEVSDDTQDVLIEAAYFDQLAIRNAARKLKLHSPSSFRFERNIDSANLDWASRRTCDLILQVAGGQLLDGVVDAGQPPVVPSPIVLRFSQIERVLGIEIPAKLVAEILSKLGLQIVSQSALSVETIPPSWRKDLTREVDLIEEVGRIHGFDKIPDNVPVPMSASYRPKSDRVIDKVRKVLTAAGFDEAVTPSLVPEPWSDAFSPWTDSPPLQSSQPMLGVLEEYSQNIGTVNLLRRSLIPSLIEARRINEYRSNPQACLFETAQVYLPLSENQIPDQPTKLGMITGTDFLSVKGIIDTLVETIAPGTKLQFRVCQQSLLDVSRSSEIQLAGKPFGWIGELSSAAKKQFGIRSQATVAEVDMKSMELLAVMIPLHQNQSSFQPMTRDFNFIVDNSIHWSDLESTVRCAGGPLLESIHYRETFRNENKDGPDKKRLLLSVVLRSDEATLTGAQAEEICNQIVQKCESDHAAALVGAN